VRRVRQLQQHLVRTRGQPDEDERAAIARRWPIEHRPQAFDVTGTWSGLRGDGGTGGERLGVVLWVDRDWAALEG